MELIPIGRLLAACIVVGLVLYGVRAVGRGVARRSATATPGGRIVAILETTALPNAASLHVLRVAERYLLVGRSASQIATLCEIPGEQLAAAREPPSERAARATKAVPAAGIGAGARARTRALGRLLSSWRLGRSDRPPV